MFYSLKGKLIHTDPTTAVIDCGGVGYKCAVSMNTLQQLPSKGETAMLYTFLVVREDTLDLYGFATPAELESFKMITSVSGVGPKVGIAILSEFTPDKLSLAIATGDSKTLTRASGVGVKLAQRITLELKDKVSTGITELDNASASSLTGGKSASGNTHEAVSALVTLGYSQSEAALAVAKLDSSLPVEQLIKDALKNLF